jgi:hypothetical protein
MESHMKAAAAAHGHPASQDEMEAAAQTTRFPPPASAGAHSSPRLKIWIRDTKAMRRDLGMSDAHALRCNVGRREGLNSSMSLLRSARTKRRNTSACGLLMALFTVLVSPGRSLSPTCASPLAAAAFGQTKFVTNTKIRA